MATSGDRLRAAALIACLALWSSGCSAAPGAGGPGERVAHGSPSRSALVPTPVTTGRTGERAVCFGAVPAGWSAALGRNDVTVADGVSFSVNATANGVALGQYRSATGHGGVGTVDLRTGTLHSISTFPAEIGGVGWMSAQGDWVVWEQLDSTSDLFNWSIHAWNAATAHSTVLATSHLPGGGEAQGPQPLPVLHDGRAAWSQPVTSAPHGVVQSEIRVADLAAGRVKVVSSGRVSSPVFSGGHLVWATVSASGTYAFEAVDAGTLAPATLPPVPEPPDSVGFLGGAPDRLAWTNRDSTTLTVWTFGRPDLQRFRVGDGAHFFQFLQFAGPFLTWFAGGASSVLDLSTGRAFDVDGTVSGSAEAIVVARTPTSPSGRGKASGPTRLSAVAPPSAPRLPACG